MKNNRSLRNKKAELTLETMVIAVLVLVVLGILLWLAYKYIWGAGVQVGGLSACQNRGGDCKPSTQCNSEQNTKLYKFGGCGQKTDKDPNGANDYCCIPNSNMANP
jgi:hypothetical protein